MPIVHDELKREVVKKLKAQSALSDLLEREAIYWRTPVVKIQDILLDDEPRRIVRTIDGVRGLSEESFTLILKNWQAKRIGGREELASDCEGKTWFPPIFSELYLLQRLVFGDSGRSIDFYLLVCQGKNHFLVKQEGDLNLLRVLSEHEDVPYFYHALRNVMEWRA